MINSSKNIITGIILAGGRSSRMGRDKALISINGIPLLEQICTLANHCASEVYVVTAWGERYQSILPVGCRLIREDTPPQGPLIAFAQALPHVKTDWVLLLACDLPLLTISEVERWSSFLSNVPEEKIALLPRQQHLWQPLCGFYRQRCLPVLNEFIEQGGRSFQDWLSRSLVEELSVSDPRLLFNCNTPEDLEKII